MQLPRWLSSRRSSTCESACFAAEVCVMTSMQYISFSTISCSPRTWPSMIFKRRMTFALSVSCMYFICDSIIPQGGISQVHFSPRLMREREREEAGGAASCERVERRLERGAGRDHVVEHYIKVCWIGVLPAGEGAPHVRLPPAPLE